MKAFRHSNAGLWWSECTLRSNLTTSGVTRSLRAVSWNAQGRDLSLCVRGFTSTEIISVGISNFKTYGVFNQRHSLRGIDYSRTLMFSITGQFFFVSKIGKGRVISFFHPFLKPLHCITECALCFWNIPDHLVWSRMLPHFQPNAQTWMHCFRKPGKNWVTCIFFGVYRTCSGNGLLNIQVYYFKYR